MWSFVRPDALVIWKNNEVKKRLSHYYAVMKGQKPAKYRVAKRIPVDMSGGESTEELWRLHDEKSKEFRDLYAEVMSRGDLGLGGVKRPNFVDLKVELARRMLAKCCLCEHRCGVNRLKGEKGFCGLDATTYVASAFLHLGEEAPLVPSGTIFFTGCSFKCVYCQNWDISSNPFNGEKVTAAELAKIAVRLYARGARNINYVGGNPDQHLHTVLESLNYMDVNVPLLWNSNMYMSLESLKLLLDVIDIWLPDFKYGNDECAYRLSRVKRYFEVVSRNLKIAHDNGDMIIRHLVLPGHIECCTYPVLEWIAENCPRALVNIMDQYHPDYLVTRYPEKYKDICRCVSSDEMVRAFTYAEKLGICYKPLSR